MTTIFMLLKDAANGVPGIVWDVTTLSAAIALVSSLDEWIDKSLWNLDGWATRIRTWVLGAAIGLAGYYIDTGIFATVIEWQGNPLSPLLGCVAVGFLCALAANLGFDAGVLRSFLEALGLRLPQAPKP